MDKKKYMDIALGIAAGLGITGLVILLAKADKQAFRNFFGGKAFLKGYPRGVRNNNPGNIEMTSGLWKGEIPHSKNTDGRFKQFYVYTYGLRAAILNIRNYHKKGYKTIRQVITRWSPPIENDTETYIRFVSGYMGIAENIPLEYNKQTVKKLVEAIIIKENGRLYMTGNDFETAWKQT